MVHTNQVWCALGILELVSWRQEEFEVSLPYIGSWRPTYTSKTCLKQKKYDGEFHVSRVYQRGDIETALSRGLLNMYSRVCERAEMPLPLPGVLGL